MPRFEQFSDFGVGGEFKEEWKMNQRIGCLLEAQVEICGNDKDKGACFLTLRGLNIKKNKECKFNLGGWDYLLYRWLPRATTAIFGANCTHL